MSLASWLRNMDAAPIHPPGQCETCDRQAREEGVVPAHQGAGWRDLRPGEDLDEVWAAFTRRGE